MTKMIMETYTNDGYHIQTIEWTDEDINPNDWQLVDIPPEAIIKGQKHFKTEVTHPNSKEKETYLYRDVQEAFAHHRYLADGNQYGDEQDSSRWNQIARDIDEDK